MDAKEKRRKRDRERYERMTDEERHEKLKKRREAYQRNKVSGKTPEQKAAKCAQEKKRYANMQTEKKKARMEQIEAHPQLKRNTPSKDSIAMENPEYLATEQEESTSTFTVKHRDHVAAGERQALLHRRNEEFTRRRKQAISVSSKEDESMTETIYFGQTSPPQCFQASEKQIHRHNHYTMMITVK